MNRGAISLGRPHPVLLLLRSRSLCIPLVGDNVEQGGVEELRSYTAHLIVSTNHSCCCPTVKHLNRIIEGREEMMPHMFLQTLEATLRSTAESSQTMCNQLLLFLQIISQNRSSVTCESLHFKVTLRAGSLTSSHSFLLPE